MSKAQGFVEATASYEKWRAGRIEVVESDLATKHAKIAQSPFVLLRGTYYRFLQQLPALVPDAWDAPKTVAIGDLHVENYGTWRDACGRIGWGINDFDEIDVQPYPVDLVRLATSTLLAISASHIELEPHAACAAILDGWHRRIEQGLPTAFVLAERHPHLLKLASETFQTPARFAKAIEALPPFDGKLAKGTVKLLDEVVPWGGFDPSLRTRTAGVGSLGSRRIVAFDEVGGGLLVRECKQVPGSAGLWLRPDSERARGLPELVAEARGAGADPWRRQTGKWVVRPLAPDASRLEFAQVKRRHDEVGFLRDMGAEAANVHLLAHSQAAPLKVLRKDARRRTERWLHGAAVKMADLTNRDHTDWVAWQSKNADKQGA